MIRLGNISAAVHPMATVLIKFDGGNVPILTGDIPADTDTPISEPVPTVFVTNRPFITAEGANCFALQTSIPYTPLWQVVRVSDGEQIVASFRRKR